MASLRDVGRLPGAHDLAAIDATIDAIVDVVAAMTAIDELGISRVACSPIWSRKRT